MSLAAPARPASPAAREIAVMLALAPGAALQALWLGPGTLLACGIAVAAALAWEAGLHGLRGRRAGRSDLAAAAGTGALLGLGLPVDGPAWLAVAGAGLALGLGRHAFGGAGSPVHPAMLGLLLLLAVAPDAMAPAAALRAPAGAPAVASALAFALGAAWLGWRGITRWTPMLAAAAGAGLGLGGLAAAGVTVPAGALPALALGAGVIATAAPGGATTPAGRWLAGLALGLAAASLARWLPGLAAVAIATVALDVLAPWIDRCVARVGAGARRTGLDAARASPSEADASEARPRTDDQARRGALAEGLRLGALASACLLALSALEAGLR